ncbi:hypothetical protein ACF3NA_03305 [Alkanindiges sp. WGS2144]|uniref:hypothetical protein n=1 Tax=Alkanindiges sp. WGS2144 TaxID=3366808 RepID=UPI0037502F6C
MIFIQNFDSVLSHGSSSGKDYIFSYANQTIPLSLSIKESNKLVIFLPGAFDLSQNLPKFQRKSYFAELPYNLISIFDPTLIMNPNLSIGWFQGDKNTDLFSIVYPILSSLIKRINIPTENILFFATSAGGIPALKLATKFRGASVYLGNIQVDALKYYKKFVDKMLISCYGGIDNLELYEHKLNVYNEFGDINVFYAQNKCDFLHYVEHFLPFVERSRSNFSNFEGVVYEHKESEHNPISKEIELKVIRDIFEKHTIKEAFSDITIRIV